MKTVTIDIADPLFEAIEAQARLSNRQPGEVIREALGHFLASGSEAASHSVIDIKSFPLGPPVKPWTTRAEMLEGFMDDRG
jgi:hypothetical protein